MAGKLDKLRADLKKAYAKRDEWNEKAADLENRLREEENTQICEVTCAHNLTPEQLAVLIELAEKQVPSGDPLAAIEAAQKESVIGKKADLQEEVLYAEESEEKQKEETNCA